MKLFAFSDVHCDFQAVERLIERARECEIVVCCGDLSRFGECLDEIAEKLAKGIKKKFLIVPGNNETPEDIERVCEKFGWINLHCKKVKINSFWFAGCGGGLEGGFATPFEVDENYFKKCLEGFRGVENLILITHTPPINTVDKTLLGSRIGSKAIRKFVEEEQPLLCLCGHVHERAGDEERIGKTRIINVGKEGKLIFL